METKQETKSLPRNRKCGNCRYFEPAPLWRKGWCRNPRLYDRRANHLVDAATIDCEQVFRARIYWEPIPTPEPVEAVMAQPTASYRAPQLGVEENSVELPVADGGNRVRQANDKVLKSAANRPVITRREKSTATPNLVRKSSNARKWLKDNIPYYDRLDGPVSRASIMTWLPWLIVGALLVIVLLNVLGGKKDATPTTTGSSSTVTTAPFSTINSGTGTNSSAVVAPNGTVKPATVTLSSALPTATAVPPTATPQAKVFAKVAGTGPSKALKMRKDPHINGPNEPTNVVVLIPEGEQVEITGPFKSAEGFNWWPISYKGQNGWAVQEYLQKNS